MTSVRKPQVWFLTGSQHLYGREALDQVADQSAQIQRTLAASGGLSAEIVGQPVLTESAAIRRVMLEANADPDCLGVIAWMHTFSPAKMWITGLDVLRKPLLHLHTQLNEALPWASIDMDFMNLNQAAHGDREFGYLQTRLRMARKTVAGHGSDPGLVARIDSWIRAAAGRDHLDGLRLARFGDNMRDVAVTEGDKVEAELRFGVSVNTYGVNDLVARVDAVPDAAVDALVAEYADSYRVAPELSRGGERHESLRYAARVEAGPAGVPGRRRVRRLHHELPGSRRAAPAARAGRAAADGRRLRVRRRGRLEDLRAARRGQGDGRERPHRPEPARYVLHGGLHLPLRTGGAEDPRRAHARGLPEHRRGHPQLRDPPARDRRPGRPGAAGLRRAAGAGHRDRDGRPRRPVPPRGQPDRGGGRRTSRCRTCRWPGRCGSRPPRCPPRPSCG